MSDLSPTLNLVGAGHTELSTWWKKGTFQSICVLATLHNFFSQWPVLLTIYYPSDQVRKYGIDEACDTCGEEARCVHGFCGETWG